MLAYGEAVAPGSDLRPLGYFSAGDILVEIAMRDDNLLQQRLSTIERFL